MDHESMITSVLSERPFKYADQKTERGKILNPEYNIYRDQPIAGASPLRINDLLSDDVNDLNGLQVFWLVANFDISVLFSTNSVSLVIHQAKQ